MWNKFFKKLKSYGFWISLSSALVILLNSLGRTFGFEIQNQAVEDCVLAIAGVLVVFGVVTSPTKDDEDENENDCENEDLKTDDE